MYSTGLGDILFTGFYTPESNGIMWGIGPAIEFPTGGEKKGTKNGVSAHLSYYLHNPAIGHLEL
jgi:hypothetical protein